MKAKKSVKNAVRKKIKSNWKKVRDDKFGVDYFDNCKTKVYGKNTPKNEIRYVIARKYDDTNKKGAWLVARGYSWNNGLKTVKHIKLKKDAVKEIKKIIKRYSY